MDYNKLPNQVPFKIQPVAILATLLTGVWKVAYWSICSFEFHVTISNEILAQEAHERAVSAGSESAAAGEQLTRQERR